MNPLENGQGVVLGVDIIGEDDADSPLPSKKPKEGQEPSEDEGAWQDDGGMKTRSDFVSQAVYTLGSVRLGACGDAIDSRALELYSYPQRTNRRLVSCRHF